VPRKADPKLEKMIVQSALRLLDEGGLPAVTMRAVADSAGTTTPTLYERFKDRHALLESLTDIHRDDLAATLRPGDTLEDTGRKVLVYCRQHPNAIELLVQRITENLRSRRPGPVYDQVRDSLIKRAGFPPYEAEQITMATSSLIAGTALLVNRMGRETAAAKDLEAATLLMLRKLGTRTHAGSAKPKSRHHRPQTNA
jgi:AcrR family transcriptional regulator